MSIEIDKLDYSENESLFLEQYKDSDKLNGVIQLWYQACRDAEDALFEIRDLGWLYTAEGVQLDQIGEIFSVDRIAGESDADYRVRIIIAINLTQSGTPEEIIEFLRNAGASQVDYYPGDRFDMIAAYIVVSDTSVTQSELEKISAAGVSPRVGGYLATEDTTTEEYIVTEDGKRILVF